MLRLQKCGRGFLYPCLKFKRLRIKALLWEGDGFLLMYKRLDNGAFRWPRLTDEAMSITEDQYRMLMQGFEIVARNPISELKETPSMM